MLMDAHITVHILSYSYTWWMLFIVAIPGSGWSYGLMTAYTSMSKTLFAAALGIFCHVLFIGKG